jgi:hypothetical protein
MRRQIIQRLSNYVPHIDAIELLTLTAGILFVFAIAIAF